MAATVTIGIDADTGSITVESGVLHLGEQAPISFAGYTPSDGGHIRLILFAADEATPLADNHASPAVLDLRGDRLRKTFSGPRSARTLYATAIEYDSGGNPTGETIATGYVTVVWSPIVYDTATGEPATMRGPQGQPGKPGRDGVDGKDGAPFTYDMFTPEQLEALRGPRGIQGLQGLPGQPGRDGAPGRDGVDGQPGKPGRDGVDGEDGAPFTYDMFTPEQLEALRGPRGIQGLQGLPGRDADPTLAGRISRLEGDDAGNSKSVREIAAEEVAQIVGGAPAAFDTLKEVADWISDDQSGAAAMAAAVENKVDKVEGKGLSKNDFTDAFKSKLEGIAENVDSALSGTSTNPVQNKVVTEALDGKLSKAEAEAGFTEWVVTPPTYKGLKVVPVWRTEYDYWDLVKEGTDDAIAFPDTYSGPNATELRFAGRPAFTATRVRLPTMSDLAAKASTNDVQLTPVYGGNGERYSDEWICSPDGAEVFWNDQQNEWWFAYDNDFYFAGNTDFDATELTTTTRDSVVLSATRIQNPVIGYVLGTQTDKPLQPQGNYLSQHQDLRYVMATPTLSVSTTDDTDDTAAVQLQDRAMNQVTLGAGIAYATLTFPTKETGKARDFFVRLTITGSDVPTLYFKEQGGASVAFDVDDDSWAEIEQGVNVLMFSDTSEASA